MKPKLLLITVVINFLFKATLYAQCVSPVINSFSPLSGAAGAIITINGSNFDPTPLNNIVFLGAAKASVQSASANQLTIVVPVGATYNHITVTSSICGLTAYSPLYFNPVSVCSGTFNASTVDARIDYSSTDPSYGPYAVLFGDFDLDGKTDVLYPTAFGNTAGLVITRNQSVPGIIDLSSALTIVTGNVRNCAIADFDRDGKLDIVFVENTFNRVSILRNISSGPGNFAFASPISLATNFSPYQVAADDIDGDGQPDLAVSHFSSINLAVFRNTSTTGSIAFSAKQDFNSGGSAQYGVGLADLDGDNKVELISTLTSNNLSVLRNSSVTGAISFASFQTFAGSVGYRLAIGDLNADGKNDIVSANLSANGVTAYRNTSILGTVSFASSTVLNTSHQNYRVSISDLNGDGRPDVVCCYNGSTVISCLLNTSTPSGAITVGSEINLNNSGCAYALGTADIDGDGNNDVITGDWCQNRKLNIFRNNVLGQIPVTNSVTPTSGLTCNSTITINYSAQCFGANPGNVYTAQLSDANGNFSVPVNIGSVSSSTSGIITGTIPACIATGTGYRVRVVGSDPAVTGTVFGTPLNINCQTITPASITTSVINPTTYCAGATVNVGYTASGSFGVCASNTFTAQLSDAGGSFASPVNIGLVVSNTSGIITAIIPANTPSGNSYRIRVVSDQPQIIGTNNGSNIIIGGAAPSIVCPDNINVTALAGQCSAIVNFSATGTGTITYSVAPGSSFPVGQTTVTTTSTTNCGSMNCTFTITVNAPASALNCPDDIVVSSPLTQCSAVVNYTAPQSVQSCCPAPASISGYTLLGNFNGHRYFISNSGFTWPAAKAAAISLGGHLVTIGSAGENNFISSHTSAGAWIGFTDEVVEGTWKWITDEPVTFTAWAAGEPNDAGGIEDHALTNWGLAYWNDLVGSNSLPYILEFECDGSGSYTVTQVSGLSSGSAFPVGITTNTFSITDGNGATTTCSFTVTVEDNEPPVITCPGNITVNNDPGVCGAVVNYGTNEFYCTNNSGTSLVKINTNTGAVTNIGPFGFADTWALGFKPDGTAWTTINWGQLASVNLTTGAATPVGVPFGFTAICLDANSSGQLYTIGWDANLYSVNTTTGALTFIANTGLGSVMDIAFDANDKLWVINSSGKLYSVNTTTGLATLESSLSGPISLGSEMGLVISPSGTFYMTEWTSNPRLFSVNPVTGVTTLVSALAASYPHGGDFSPFGGGATATDNCGIPTVMYNPVSGSVFPIGTTTVTATATDAAGNTSTCSFTVTVTDKEKPTVTKGNIGSCYSSVISAEAAVLEATTYSDNCSSFEELDVNVSTSGSCNAVITITITDASNNSRSVTYNTRIENTPPVLSLAPGNVTVNCQSIPPVPTVTASDNCDGSVNVTFTPTSTQGSDPAQSNYYNYTIIREWYATDGCGNTVEHVQTITVQDVTAPQITCPADKLSIPFDFGQLYATIPIGSSTATDNCAANANIAIAGTRSDNVSITNQQYPLGQTTVAWTATDPSDNSDGCTQTITVRKRNTAVTYTGDMIDNKICVQYSDIINLQAKLTDNEGLVTPNNISGRSITFQLLSGATVLRSKTATTNASGVAVDTFKIEQAPGLYSVKTIFTGDAYFNGSNDQDNCEVKQEDAIVEYNGSQYFTTASSTTLVGSITLAASLNDIDDGSDKRGDIRKAKATFRDGGPGGTVLGSANLPVGLVNPGVLTNGLSATTQNNITLNSNDASSGGKIFQVWVGASDHYTGADAGPTPVTLALPGQDFVTGGGHLKVTNSAGTYAGTVNSKMNFGFTMKWNKSGKNLQGNINIVFRKWQLYNGVWQWRVYQAKSNAINSMAVLEVGSNGLAVTATNPALFRKAIINTKANLKDVTDPLNNIDLGGNHNLTLDAWDHITANGGVNDKISVTLMGATTNELLFSSSWISNATAAQTISGGNINVRNGSSGSSTSINTVTKSHQLEVAVKEEEFVVRAYPNPTNHQFTLTISSNLNEAIVIQLYDVAGRKIQTLNATAYEVVRFGEKLKAGIYIAQVMQGNRRESIKLIKQ